MSKLYEYLEFSFPQLNQLRLYRIYRACFHHTFADKFQKTRWVNRKSDSKTRSKLSKLKGHSTQQK